MTSFLNLDQPVERTSAPLGRPSVETVAAVNSPAQTGSPAEDGAEFEIVFGRRQMAGTGLVLIVVLACASGVSYLIGKSTAAPKTPVPANAPATVPAEAPAIASSPSIPAKPVADKPGPSGVSTDNQAVSKAPTGSADHAPIFAEAVPGKVYIQVGAIDKGLAGIWAEGLRTHGLAAFVSAGPSDRMWRVLIGPLPDPQAYERAQGVLDQLGVSTFGRRYADASH